MSLIILTGCGKRSVSSSAEIVSDRNVFAMDTFMTMRAYGRSGENALEKAENRIHELEALLSVTAEGSDIQRINNSGGVPVEVSSETGEVISEAVKIGNETNGALDITMYSVLRAWGFTEDEFRIPEEAEIAGLLEKLDYSRVSIDGRTVALPDEYQLDLGALAKGYTSDKVIETLKKNGVESAVISLGGNVQTLGEKPDGTKWNIAVRNPFFPETDMCILQTGETAVITSGNYERFFIGENGRKYWHILDPDNGYPAENGVVSVTVIGKSGLYCDALSTALFVMGKDRAVEFWMEKQDFDMILVTYTQEILYTKGIKSGFTNLTEMHSEVIGYD